MDMLVAATTGFGFAEIAPKSAAQISKLSKQIGLSIPVFLRRLAFSIGNFQSRPDV
jgi:hypothetical protein